MDWNFDVIIDLHCLSIFLLIKALNSFPLSLICFEYTGL